MKLQIQRLETIIQFSLGLDEEIDKITQKAYYFEGFNVFCMELKSANDVLRSIFLKELLHLKSTGHLLQFAVLNEAFDTWGSLRALINIIEDVRMDNYPKETMYPFLEFIQENNMDCDIFATDMEDINFSFMEFWLHFRARLDRLGGSGFSNRKRVWYQYPKFQRDNILLGTIMSHEFGHYLDLTEFKTSASSYNKFVNSTDFNSLYPYVNGAPPGTDCRLILQSILHTNTSTNNNIVLNWITELFADIYATLLYGPAFYFAQAEFMLFGSYKASTNQSNINNDLFVISHPPNTLRTYAITKILTNIGVFDHLSEPIKEKFDLYKQIFDVPKGSVQVRASGDMRSLSWPGIYLSINQGFYIALFDVMYQLIDVLIAEAISVFPQHFIFNKDSWLLSQDPVLKSKIMNLVPPNEIDRKPVPLPVIINCGWVCYYSNFEELVSRYFGSLNEEQRRFRVFQVLSSLIRKALESSHIQKKWIQRSLPK